MFRDRTVRAFSLLVLLAGAAAIVVTAGAQWTGGQAHRTLVIVTTRTTAAPVDDPTMNFVAHPPGAPRKQSTASVARLTLPRSVPATMLPAGSSLPTLAPLPNNPWAPRQATRLGRIVIPAIGLDQPFFEGVDQAAFAHGVGHWPGSAAPGGWGNAVFGGHRVTETHPFLDTDKLRSGDEIHFVMLNGWTVVYRVTDVFVVPQTATWIADQKPGRTLTLFTCNPKGSSTQRLVTSGVLLRIDAPT